MKMPKSYKSTLFSIALSGIVYMQSKGWIGGDEAVLLSSIVTSCAALMNIYINNTKT